MITDKFPRRTRAWIVVLAVGKREVIHAVRCPYTGTVDPHKLQDALVRKYNDLDEKYEDTSKYDMVMDMGPLATIQQTMPELWRLPEDKLEELVVPS